MPVICAVLFLFVLVGWLSYSIYISRRIDNNVYIFRDLGECRALTSYEGDASVALYDATDPDKEYKGQTFTDFVGMDYQSGTMVFTLYAYEFENEDQAKQYFVDVTGQKYDSDYYYLLSSGNTFRFRIVVAFENKAYRIEAKNKYIKQVCAMIAECFSIQLDGAH